MGITIHYDLESSKGLNKEMINKVISFVEESAKMFNYEYFISREQKGYVSKIFTRHLDGKVTTRYYSSEFFDEDSDLNSDFKESGFKENENQKKIVFNSICINNKVNGDFMSESFEIGFFKNPFTKKYEWFGSGFTKTQIFNEKETIPNLKFHIYLIKVLQQLKLRFLPSLSIHDEAYFFFTEQDREEQIESWTKSLKDKNDAYHDIAEKYLKEWKLKKPYSMKELVKSHGSNLSLIQSIGEKLQGLGFEKSNIRTSVENGDEFLQKFYEKLCENLGV